MHLSGYNAFYLGLFLNRSVNFKNVQVIQDTNVVLFFWGGRGNINIVLVSLESAVVDPNISYNLINFRINTIKYECT